MFGFVRKTVYNELYSKYCDLVCEDTALGKKYEWLCLANDKYKKLIEEQNAALKNVIDKNIRLKQILKDNNIIILDLDEENQNG